MTRLPIDDDKYAQPPATPLVGATLALVKDLVRRRLDESGLTWADFVAGKGDGLIGKADMEAIETRILESGHRFEWSAQISVAERPDAYKSGAAPGDADFSFEHPDAPAEEPGADGHALRGIGDNVVSHPSDVVGTARYIRTNERVLQYLTEGVPPGTVAVIDDSGGTLTAPIIEQFAGVICAGGTVRSHLGILTREYGIPCLMNAKVSGIRDGDQVKIEASAAAKTAEDYQEGVERTARIWRLTPS